MQDAGSLVSACRYKSSGEIRRFATKRLVDAACRSVVRHSNWSRRNHRDRESECKEFGFADGSVRRCYSIPSIAHWRGYGEGKR